MGHHRGRNPYGPARVPGPCLRAVASGRELYRHGRICIGPGRSPRRPLRPVLYGRSQDGGTGYYAGSGGLQGGICQLYPQRPHGAVHPRRARPPQHGSAHAKPQAGGRMVLRKRRQGQGDCQEGQKREDVLYRQGLCEAARPVCRAAGRDSAHQERRRL